MEYSGWAIDPAAALHLNRAQDSKVELCSAKLPRGAEVQRG